MSECRGFIFEALEQSFRLQTFIIFITSYSVFLSIVIIYCIQRNHYFVVVFVVDLFFIILQCTPDKWTTLKTGPFIVNISLNIYNVHFILYSIINDLCILVS